MKTASVLGLLIGVVACSGRVSLGDLGGAGMGGALPGGSAGGAQVAGQAAGGQAAGGSAGGAQAAGGYAAGEAGGSTGLGGALLLPLAGCASTLDQTVPISPKCPDQMPPDTRTPCDDAVENGICVWQWELESGRHGYYAAGCYQGLTGKFWQGVYGSNTEPFEPRFDLCPKQAPEQGASCNSADQLSCLYPTKYCECMSIFPDRWLCSEDLAGKTSPPVEVARLCTPVTVKETRRVVDLTPAQALDWCEWYATVGGRPATTVSGQDSPGTANSYPYEVRSTPEMPVCVADLPPELCVKNLATKPCTATLAELDDCVETIRAAPLGWVGHGCAPLLANPTCSGIIVEPYTTVGKISQCSVPLE